MFPRMRDHKAFRERRAHTKQQQNGLKEIARRTPRSHRSAVGLVGALGETPGAEREILRQEGRWWRRKGGRAGGSGKVKNRGRGGGMVLANNATDKSLRKKRNRESKSDARAEAAAEVKFNRLCAMGQRCLVVAQSPFGTR